MSNFNYCVYFFNFDLSYKSLTLLLYHKNINLSNFEYNRFCPPQNLCLLRKCSYSPQLNGRLFPKVEKHIQRSRKQVSEQSEKDNIIEWYEKTIRRYTQNQTNIRSVTSLSRKRRHFFGT